MSMAVLPSNLLSVAVDYMHHWTGLHSIGQKQFSCDLSFLVVQHHIVRFKS